jgi:hypothetical protein
MIRKIQFVELPPLIKNASPKAEALRRLWLAKVTHPSATGSTHGNDARAWNLLHTLEALDGNHWIALEDEIKR